MSKRQHEATIYNKLLFLCENINSQKIAISLLTLTALHSVHCIRIYAKLTGLAMVLHSTSTIRFIILSFLNEVIVPTVIMNENGRIKNIMTVLSTLRKLLT